jgi:hypothetical protein
MYFLDHAMKVSILPILLLAMGGEAAATPLSFVCSAPLERDSSLWKFRTAGAPFRVRGRMLAVSFDPLPADPRRRDGDVTMTYTFVRGAEVLIMDDNGKNVSLSFNADPAGRTLEVGVTTSSGDRHDGMVVERHAAGPGTSIWVPFELSVEAARGVLRIGTREIPLDIALGASTQITVSCAGGEFWFQDLEIDS